MRFPVIVSFLCLLQKLPTFYIRIQRCCFPRFDNYKVRDWLTTPGVFIAIFLFLCSIFVNVD